MDSFYEQPRPAPIPMSRNEIHPAPVVPEVSLLLPNNTVEDHSLDSMYLTYSTWKNRNQRDVTPNFCKQTDNLPSQESFSSKQVRFESPVVHKQLPNELANTPVTREQPRPFENIYMANVPNRNLDLSIIEPPKMLHNVYKENINPNINLGYSSSKQETLRKVPYEKDPLAKNQVVDIYNYRRTDFEVMRPYTREETVSNSHKIPSPHYEHIATNTKCNASMQTDYKEEPKNLIVESSDEPTVKDLLKIIQQQNNQLLMLQKQVSTLLSANEPPKRIESHPNRNFNYRTSTQLNSQQNMWQALPFQKKGPLKQFSVDVMTSFEVAFRTQQNVNRKDINQPPKIFEVTETNSTASNDVGNILDDIPKFNRKYDDSFKTGEVSLTFNEPVHVRQTCPSPENSIQIEMKEYSSDSDDDDLSLCNNVRAQVNHILKQTGIQPRNDSPLRTNRPISQNKLKRKVKESTIKHLRSIGVHIPTNYEDIEDELDGPDQPHQDDISFMVKQILMKYLPDEQLGKITCENVSKKSQNNFIKRRPEFSFASVQYMQKYNLLAGLTGNEMDKQNVRFSPHQEPTFERILDVTAIRQQPKLL